MYPIDLRVRRPVRGILDTIGNTPLVELQRVLPDADFRIFAKLEGFNPGGSAKDRPALRMLEAAIARGEIDSASTIVESSSGNLAVGLAQVCASKGLRLIVVADPKMTATNLKIVRLYGAEVDMVTEPCPETGEFLSARMKRVRELVSEIPGAYNLNQYANPDNYLAHRDGTMTELIDALGERIDYLFVSVSTCGTLRGCRAALDRAGLTTQIIAVDAAGSAIFGRPGTRLLPGHGAGVVPEQMVGGLENAFELVTDADCVAGARVLLRREGIMAGASSGGLLSAIARWRPRIPPRSRVAAIFVDRGERYLETMFDDAWCRSNFGFIPDTFPEAALEDAH